MHKYAACPGFTDLPLFACLLTIGVATGLFMTPNTSSIMTGVPNDRRA